MDDEADARHRLVYVLEVDREYGFATVALATNEVDLATPDDVLLRRDRSEAPVDLLVELGIVAPIWWAQLGPALAKLALEDIQDDPTLRGAMPLRRRDDIRWAFKESELRDLQMLAADCARTVIDEPGASKSRQARPGSVEGASRAASRHKECEVTDDEQH